MELFASTISLATSRVAHSWPWYITRGAGFVAAALLIALMLSGIGQFTGLTFRFIEPRKAWAIHKAMGLALCAAVVFHVGFLLIDKFMPFRLTQILVPFTSNYNNGTTFMGLALGSLAVAMGVLAMYGIATIILTSLTMIDVKRQSWHLLHYISYAVVFFVFLHALYVGTDLKYGTFRAAWITVGSILTLGIVYRLFHAFTLSRKK